MDFCNRHMNGKKRARYRTLWPMMIGADEKKRLYNENDKFEKNIGNRAIRLRNEGFYGIKGQMIPNDTSSIRILLQSVYSWFRVLKLRKLLSNGYPSWCLIFSLFFCCSLTTAMDSKNDATAKGIICSSMDIRNSADSFKHLSECRVIEGFLQIVLMDRTVESDFANLTFPKLYEITDYLLLYRVNGLHSLSKLFPNLSVIRGQHLFINYALAIYEMLHLREIGLHSLVDIPRGSVLIAHNPQLCYIDTIDWNRIVTSGKELNLISENREKIACPKCPNFGNNTNCAISTTSKEPLCWNADHCQRSCGKCESKRCSATGECCNEYCLGGCTGPKTDQCFSCRNFFIEDTNDCVAKCPSTQYLMFKDRRCIKISECYNMPKPRGEFSTSHIKFNYPWKPFEGSCIIDCPQGYEEVGVERNLSCQRCNGTCRKVCEPANVDSIQSAQRLKGCVVINGSLEIQIRGGGNVVKELEDGLSMIEEIKGYLKIVRSLSIVSLHFLRNLKYIGGESLESNKYALIVLDNQNLVELWDFNKNSELRLGNGSIFFHFNPKLCYSKIRALIDRLNLTSVDNYDAGPTSNGDKVACNVSLLLVDVNQVKYSAVTLEWVPYWHYELRTLLGYVIYLMEAPNQNVSLYDGRDACGTDGWRTYDVEVPDQSSPGQVDANTIALRSNVTQLIPHLKPYTQYAYYVKTYTIATETNGAQSPIQYFRTLPYTPSPPRHLSVTVRSSSSITIQWRPPEFPNGKLVSYVITGSLTPEGQLLRDYCVDPAEYDKKERTTEKVDEKKVAENEQGKDAGQCSCETTAVTQKRIKKSDEEVLALMEFEDNLQNAAFSKKSPSKRIRRSAGSESMFGHFLRFGRSAGADYQNSTMENTPERFTITVSSNQLTYEVNNLKHFSLYTINVKACREEIIPKDHNTIPEGHNCSAERMATVKTNPLPYADKINESSIVVKVTNNSTGDFVQIKWDEPSITNGRIIAYQVKYKRVDVVNQQPITECVSRQNFINNHSIFTLKNLHAGNYSFAIKATSLANDIPDNSTPLRYFYIKETNSLMMYQLIMGAFLALIVVVLILIAVVIILRYFYPGAWHNKKFLFASVNPEYFKPAEGYDQWEISRKKLAFEGILGVGHFGEVYEGRAKGIIQKGVTTRVAIKTLNKIPSTQKAWMAFLNEASVMKQFDATHVVKLLGVVTKGTPLVIMEFMDYGDLRAYLRSCRDSDGEEPERHATRTPPTLKEVIQMAGEIADGMLYLADKKFVHRDLAARNCMINAEKTVKIGDFGLTRDIYETDYYRKDSKGHLPVRWMAPESLRDGVFTSKSDVWSYGIVLWEMATLASLPYTGLGNGEVMPFVVNGGIMNAPENCHPILAELMRMTWQYKYAQRPTFSDILEILLPNLREDFPTISYFHTEEAVQLRSSKQEVVVEEAETTPTYTPLRVFADLENFSVYTNEEDEGRVTESTNLTNMATIHNIASLNQDNFSGPPTDNGYVHKKLLNNVSIPLISPRTTTSS